MFLFTNYLPILWLAVVVSMVILEAATYQLVAIWFALGGIGALLAATAGLWGFRGQFTLFVAISVVSLIGTRPFIRKVLRGQPTPTNADRIIGQEAGGKEPSSPRKKGRGPGPGLDWSANATEEIPAGAVVEILSIEGATVHVCPKERP